jgi:2-keto-3-deoxy-L-rhamnonate aldolase RhmA
VFIDLEHTTLDLTMVQTMIMTAERAGITPIVRPPGLDAGLIQRVLDAGAQGIFVPHVHGASGAREAVDVVRYPPLGSRGLMPVARSSGYGRVPVAELMEYGRSELLLITSIEDLVGLEEVEQIAQTDGLDIIAIGPSDLSRALGVPGTANHPSMLEAVKRISEAARRGRKGLAIPNGNAALPQSLSALRELGVVYTNCSPGPEVRLLRGMTEQVSELRSNLEVRSEK